VRDSGIGIRKEELDKVFERFYRCGDELTRTVRGTGLGLSWSRKSSRLIKDLCTSKANREKGAHFPSGSR